ncbi:hypothetical protein BAX97_04655 [Elizabethkingia meningoseptica]|uniref:hypothetical protein n=1 Tax=Elizabethkingia meningoseptica TaxID=238 RepID=UPI00099AE43C|nr:hypothetical protein [Elizabethkingia meningoseptica]OPC33592.1 hypothetical protein BAX97_04655 [Elizabethkingia meningoseptica]
MKKIIFLTWCFLFYSFTIRAQNLENEYKTLKDNAIEIYVNEFYTFYTQEMSKNIQTENFKLYKQQLSNKINNLYLLDENNRSFKIKAISKIQFKEIDIYDKKNRNILKKGINVWKVIEVLNRNKITIRIIDSSVMYKNKNYQFTSEGGAEIVFEYSCKENQWKLLTKKHSGI